MTGSDVSYSDQEVRPFAVQGMSNADYVEFMMKVQSMLKQYPVVVAGLGNMVMAFDELVSKLNDSLAAEHGSSFTMTLADSDKCRDAIHRGLCHFIEAFRWHKDGAKVDAANHLKRIVKRYGLHELRNGYDQETGLIRKLVEDLRSAKNSDYVDQIGLSQWIDDLDKANSAFSTLMEGRLEEAAGLLGYTTQDVRKIMTPHFRKMIKVVEGNAILGTASAFQDFIHKLNIDPALGRVC
jgi:hypothetical protein